MLEEAGARRRRMHFQEVTSRGTGLQAYSFPQLPKLSQPMGRGALFVRKNSGIVDFSLWLRNDNRRMNQATGI